MWCTSGTLVDSPLEYDSSSESINFSVSNNVGSSHAMFKMLLDTASPNNGDPISELRSISDDSAGNETIYTRVLSNIGSSSSGSEQGYVNHGVMSYGTLRDILLLTGDGDGTSRPGVFVRNPAGFGIGTDNIDSSSTIEVHDDDYVLKLIDTGNMTITRSDYSKLAVSTINASGTVTSGILEPVASPTDMHVGKIGGTSYVTSDGLLYVESRSSSLILGATNGGITLTSSASSQITLEGVMDNRPGSYGHLKTAEFSLADGASTPFETYFDDDLGWLFITLTGDGSGELAAACGGAQFYLQGSNNTVDVISNLGGEFSSSDSPGLYCVFSDGDGTYTIRNRTGSTKHAFMMYMGTR
jgi:hypothetical protein